MYFLSEFLWSFSIAVIFLIVAESCGSLFLNLINLFLKRLPALSLHTNIIKHSSSGEACEPEILKPQYTNDSSSNSYWLETENPALILRIIAGLLILGMMYFWLGVFNLFYKDILLLTALVFPTIRFSFRIIKATYFNFKTKLRHIPSVKKNSILIKLDNFWVNIKEQRYLLSGLSLFSILSFPAAFRPIIQFDAIWYHLTIPKLFLQAGNINYNGEFLRYSVHPYLNFFWNSLFLSTPQNLVIQGLAINIFQWILIILGMYFALKTISKLTSIPAWLLILAPSLLGILNNVTNAYGAGYNDLYGVAITLFLIPFLYQLSLQKEINIKQIIWVLLSIITLTLLKIFFALFGGLVFIYLIWLILDKQNSKFTSPLKLSENDANILLTNDINSNYNGRSKVIIKLFIRPSLPIKNYLIEIQKFIANTKLSFIRNNNFWIGFGLTALTFGLIFILPWIVRSFTQTGRLLDPIGAPGINEDAYNFSGSKTALNHWTYFVWVRLAKNLLQIPLWRYSPLLGLAFILPFFKQFQLKKYLSLWLLGMSGFWSIYIFSIVSEWRYFLPAVYTLLIVLIIFVAENWSNWKGKFSKKTKWIVIAGCCFVIVFNYGLVLKTTDLKSDMYIFQGQTSDEYLTSRVSQWQFGYYKNEGSFQPENLTATETILVLNLQGMAYVSNPILSPRAQPELFQNLENINDLTQLLKDKNVSFVLMKNQDISKLCEQAWVKNCSLEELNSQFKLEGKIDEEKVWWYSLR